METIDREWIEFVVLGKMESHESYQVMEYFVDEIDD